eukprot:TRINITY_DN315_c0_g1_i1.p1 TRINITY_DN315_c0_g1~~TRINITY_DN315_c0_g1_i1.p1  ORF type:complete len:1270 (+),score=220.97 TRINITY_DN315_c0_g1_i1:2620-6429(+)
MYQQQYGPSLRLITQDQQINSIILYYPFQLLFQLITLSFILCHQHVLSICAVRREYQTQKLQIMEKDPTIDKYMQQQYISAVEAENAKAKDRIAALRSEITRLDVAYGRSSPRNVPQDTSIPSPVTVLPVFCSYTPQKPSNAPIIDSPASELPLTQSQELRVQQMLSEELRDKVERIGTLKDGIQALRVGIDEKCTRKEELAKMYEEKRKEIEQTQTIITFDRTAEKEVKKEIEGLNKKIETDAIYFRRELTGVCEEMKKTKAKLDKHYKKHEALLLEKGKYEKALEDVKKEADSSYICKVAKFSASVAPLEDAIKTIGMQKEKLMQKIACEEEKLRYNDNCLGMLFADFEGRQRQRSELIEMKKELEAKMAEFKKRYKEELQLFFEELDVEGQLKRAKNEKRRMEEKVKGNEKSRLGLMQLLKENEGLLKKLKQQNSLNEKSIKTALAHNLEKIKRHEKSIETACRLDSTAISRLILEEAKKTGANIEKAVFALQNSLIESEIAAMIENQSNHSEDVKRKISNLENETAPQRTAQKLKEEQVKFLNEKFETSKSQFEERLKAIEQWRVKMKAKYKIDQTDPISIELLREDPELVKAVAYKLAEYVDNEDMKGKIESEFEEYVKKLVGREYEIQKAMAKAENAKSHLAEVIAETKDTEKKLLALEQEGIKYKSVFGEICVNVKSLENQKMEKQLVANSKIRKKEDEEYKVFLRKNNEIFKGVLKNYGVKMAEKIKAEHKKEIGELALVQQVERRNEIRKVHETLQRISFVIELSEPFDHLELQINYVQFLAETFNQFKEIYESALEKRASFNMQLTALLEAEKEVTERLEEFLRHKKIELEQSTQTFYRKKNYETAQRLAFEASEKLTKQKAKLTEEQQKYEAFEKKLTEKKTGFAFHKAEQRMRLEATHKQMDEIQKVLKPHLRVLKKQIDEYSAQIINDKKRVGILSEKLNHSINNANITRRVLESADKEGSILISAEPKDETKKSERQSVLANPSESSSVPKYGCINVNLADLNESAEEVVASEVIEKSVTELGPSIVYSGTDEENSKYKLDLDKCSVREAQLFESIKSLLEGFNIYKKYKVHSSLKEKIFDPLLSCKVPPEACGFGKRTLIYNPSTYKIEFRNLKKPFTVDYSVPLVEIKKLIVPTETRQIIRAQRKLGLLGSDMEKSLELSRGGEELEKKVAPEGKLDRLSRNEENALFLEQCATVRFYQFSTLTNDSRIEVIAEGYSVFKDAMAKIGKLLEDLRLGKSLSKKLIAIQLIKETI